MRRHPTGHRIHVAPDALGIEVNNGGRRVRHMELLSGRRCPGARAKRIAPRPSARNLLAGSVLRQMVRAREEKGKEEECAHNQQYLLLSNADVQLRTLN
jgi:hypothetical protein